MTSSQTREMPSPGTIPKVRCGKSEKTVLSAAMTMSASRTYSLCTDAGPLNRGHDRHLQVDKPLHYPAALRSRLVPDRWLARVVQALPVDLGHEPVAGAGQYQHLVLPVIPDLVQGPRQVAVHLPGERCRATFGLEPERQHACARAGEGKVLERGEVCGLGHFHVGTPLAHE